MATAYEEEAKNWADMGFYQGYLEQLKKQEEQKKNLRSLFEWKFHHVPDEQLREQIIQEGLTNPAHHAPTLVDYLNARNEEAKTGKNLEAIVDTMPENRLPLALSITNPIKSKKLSKLEQYHLIMSINLAYHKAEKEKDEETKEKLSEPIKGLVADYLLSDEVTTDKDTRKFLGTFVSVMSPQFSSIIFNYQSKKANDYIKDNPREVRSYVYNILKADEKQRVNFYNTVFAQAS